MKLKELRELVESLENEDENTEVVVLSKETSRLEDVCVDAEIAHRDEKNKWCDKHTDFAQRVVLLYVSE